VPEWGSTNLLLIIFKTPWSFLSFLVIIKAHRQYKQKVCVSTSFRPYSSRLQLNCIQLPKVTPYTRTQQLHEPHRFQKLRCFSKSHQARKTSHPTILSSEQLQRCSLHHFSTFSRQYPSSKLLILLRLEFIGGRRILLLVFLFGHAHSHPSQILCDFQKSRRYQDRPQNSRCTQKLRRSQSPTHHSQISIEL
jgi:hypothetical protein